MFSFFFLVSLRLLWFLRNFCLLDYLGLRVKIHDRELGWVTLKEDLSGRLAELRNLSLKSEPLHRVIQDLQIDFALVSYWMEHVIVLDRALLCAKDEVDPLVKILTHIVRLERLTMLLKEFLGRAGPLWQRNGVHTLAIRSDAHVKVLIVGKEVGVVLEELRN